MLIFMLLLTLYFDVWFLHRFYFWPCYVSNFIPYLSLNISHIYYKHTILLSSEPHAFNQKTDADIHPSPQIYQDLAPLALQFSCNLTYYLALQTQPKPASGNWCFFYKRACSPASSHISTDTQACYFLPQYISRLLVSFNHWAIYI